MEFLRLQAHLNRNAVPKPDGGIWDDETTYTRCPGCGLNQPISEAVARGENGSTYYRCKNGCMDLVCIFPDSRASSGYGFWTVAPLCGPPGSKLPPHLEEKPFSLPPGITPA